MHIAAARGGTGRRADRGLGWAGTELKLTGPAALIARGEAWDEMTARNPPLMKLNPVPEGAGISIIAPASFARQERVELGWLRCAGSGMRRDLRAMRRRADRCSLPEPRSSGSPICTRRFLIRKRRS